MAKKSQCKCKSAECEECPEWIFTFADLVMLMMGFFVILWVLKPTSPQKPTPQNAIAQTDEWLETVGEIRGGFGWEPNPKSPDAVDQAILRKRARNGIGAKGRMEHESKGAEGTDPEVTSIRPGEQATVGGRLLFDPGSAALLPATKLAIDQIAVQIRGHRNIVLVKGHTALDDYPEGTSAEAMMDLSLRRAQAAADYLVRVGVEPEILRVEGCSTFEPIAQRAYTSAAQSQNRRVEVEATAKLVEELQDRKNAPAARTAPAMKSESPPH
jgi:flagellar motor protein MotB